MRTHFILLFLILKSLLQSQEQCGSTEALLKWFALQPQKKEAFEKKRAELSVKWQNKNATDQMVKSKMSAASFTIPVVFHILHQGGSENISDAQVIDAVAILNRDYQKMNPDTTNVVSEFKNNIGNAQIAFALATRDPNGNCTNGIIRHWDPKTIWTDDFIDYQYSWPRANYLNVYVVKWMGGTTAGYTFLPGSGVPDEVDAIVILSGYVGSIGSAVPNGSRVLTHEVGHWLGLEHTWGWTNSPGVACGDDNITDTPYTMGFTSCNLNNAAICTPGITENVQNYMEYAYCARMFTSGQAAAMQVIMMSSVDDRHILSSPGNLFQTGITNPGTGCLPMVKIVALPSAVACSGNTISMKSFTHNATPVSYQWSGTGLQITSPNSSVTSVMAALAGTYTISCTVSNASGSHTDSQILTVLNGQPQVTGAYSESFESQSNQLPQNWTVINQFNPGWKTSTDAASLGAHSVLVPGENLAAFDSTILESPSFDFKNHPGASFTFKWAYARPNQLQKDLFSVQASKDCGGTWTTVWAPNTTILANASGGIKSSMFIPSGNEWQLKDLTANSQFYPFLNEENVRIRFRFQEDLNGSGHGSRFYLDEINFSFPVGLNEATISDELIIYPNPATGNCSATITGRVAGVICVEICSLTGSVLSATQESLPPGDQLILPLEGFAPGIYFLRLTAGEKVLTKKLVITQ